MLKSILSSVVLLTLAGAVPSMATETSEDKTIRVIIDQAKVSKVPTGTATLVIGNPMIADVTMLKGGVGMVITGKSYGQTNVIALDSGGNVLTEQQLRVEPGSSVLVVQRGDSRASYSCDPQCMPTIQIGDDDKVFAAVGGQVSQRNGLASGQQGK